MPIMQGDAYGMQFRIKLESGTVVTDADVKDVEITVGRLTKNMTDGVTFADGLWVLPLSQGESFKIPPNAAKIQVRVAWLDGTVEGVELNHEPIIASVSRKVL